MSDQEEPLFLLVAKKAYLSGCVAFLRGNTLTLNVNEAEQFNAWECEERPGHIPVDPEKAEMMATVRAVPKLMAGELIGNA